MHLNIHALPPGGPAATLACAILSAQADRLDRLNAAALDELDRYATSRERFDNLIQSLIDRRDEMDEDPDLEPSFGEVMRGHVDEAEDDDPAGGDIVDEPHDQEPDESSLGWSESESISGRLTAAGWSNDELEEVSEDEGAQCDDEGDRWSDGPADRDALELEYGECGACGE